MCWCVFWVVMDVVGVFKMYKRMIVLWEDVCEGEEMRENVMVVM